MLRSAGMASMSKLQDIFFTQRKYFKAKFIQRKAIESKQARKPRSYASLKPRPTDSITHNQKFENLSF